MHDPPDPPVAQVGFVDGIVVLEVGPVGLRVVAGPEAETIGELGEDLEIDLSDTAISELLLQTILPRYRAIVSGAE